MPVIEVPALDHDAMMLARFDHKGIRARTQFPSPREQLRKEARGIRDNRDIW